MNKNAIKKFATEARRELISRVSQRALKYGISEKEVGNPNDDSVNGHLLSSTEKKQRAALIEQIKEKGYEQVMEEVAYTWFNRFSALRFMEVNGYLPTRVRVFTDENNAFKPQILTEAIHMELDGLDMEKVYAYKEANDDDELYKYLLITQCNALGRVLPGMFQKISDYTELLFPDNLLREGSVVHQMIERIDEEDWKEQVEIIGWLYQYYISNKHDEVVDVRKKSAISKENVPAATQIFTTDWVVKYMVENSLGKYWMRLHPDSQLKSKMDFYIESEEEPADEPRSVENITFLDSCMGSGHVLAYAFDIFLEMYREQGYSDREAVQNIISNNLYGIDVDERAYQLASFSIAMKARAIDRRFLNRKIALNLIHVPESNEIHAELCRRFLPTEYVADFNYIIKLFKDAKEFGSLIKPENNRNYIGLYEYLINYHMSEVPDIDENLFVYGELPELILLTKAAIILGKKYSAVCTNPPYHNKYDKALEKFVLEKYKCAKADLYSIFILRNLEFCEMNGFSGMMTPHGWMFTKAYEEVRRKVIDEKSISTLVHMAKGAFYSEAAVDICSFVLRNKHLNINGTYVRLDKFKGDMDVQKQAVLSIKDSSSCDYVYSCNSDNFYRIDGCPISYWVTENVYKDFENGLPMKQVSPPRQGMATTNNNRFLRMWFEVDFAKIGFGMQNEDMSAESGKRYFPYNKGGEFRRWYGNNYYVVNFENHGKELCDYIDVTAAPKFNHKNRVINRDFYFRECITWSDISAEFSGRYCPEGFIFDIKGSSGFPPKDKLLYILGLLNSKLTQAFIDILNPTITTQVGDMSRIPIIYGNVENIEDIVRRCVEIGKRVWDEHEISWDFLKSPLIKYAHNKSLAKAFEKYSLDFTDSDATLKNDEIEINELFFSVYGVNEMLDEYVSRDTIAAVLDKQQCVKEFISYAVGCMFGRYSLDVEGLAYAGGTWDAGKYKSFEADKDNIIPICDDEYFEDDIVGRFVKFVEVVYGKDTLEENLKFIADALGGNGQPKEVIRKYFINGFYTDHCKMYQKRPIYWMFDSGKKNGFKCLIYMHRYQPDTLARIRTDYVHEQQARYRTAIADLDNRIANASTGERVKLNKQLKTLNDQAKEIHEYEEKIHHLADQMISIDLDDGVKKNYAIFQDVLAKIK